MSSFTEIPVLDYSLSLDEATKSTFLDELRHVLLDVGFCYIKNTGIDEALQDEVVRLAKAFFDLPESEKLRIEMKNCKPHCPWRLGHVVRWRSSDMCKMVYMIANYLNLHHSSTLPGLQSSWKRDHRKTRRLP